MNSDFDNLEDLTPDNLENATRPQLYRLSKQLNLKSFNNITEMKQEILLCLMKQKGYAINKEFYASDFKERKEIMVREDKLRRSYLKEYITEVESIYQSIVKLKPIRVTSGIDISEKDDPLKSKIMNEFGDIEEQFRIKHNQISQKFNCSLLICGDSGAGKSSFINLLVNENLLPTSIRSNTSCQVKLTFGEEERSEIIDLNDSEVLIERKDFSGSLKNYLENLDDRTTLSCKSATIFLNSPVLECGLDIYDTVGLGENKMFNEDLTKHIEEITGVLILLKKNSPIGDNVVGGLSQIINNMIESGIPGCSMHFIINMCDLLENSLEKENLKKNLIEQIRDKCFGLIPDITTFSSKQELFLQQNGCVSKDYQNITLLIQQLHMNSISTATISTCEFLIQFVWKTIDYIIESEKFAASDKVHKREYIHKLRNLESDRNLLNQSFKELNDRFLKEKKEMHRKEIEKHFRLDETKGKIINEVLATQRSFIGITEKDEIDKIICQETQDMIMKHLEEFIQKDKMLKECCDEMIKVFLAQFSEHQKKKDMINNKMNRYIETVMNDIKDFKTMNFNDLIGLPSHQRKVLRIFTPIINPNFEVKSNSKIKFGSWIYWFFNSKFSSSNILSVYNDTPGYIKRKSGEYYNKFINKSRNFKMMSDCVFQVPYKVAEDFDKYLMDDMKYLAKNIDLLYDDMRNRDNVFKTYKEIKKKLDKIINDLSRFALFHLQKEKYDTMKYSLEIELESDPVVQNRNRLVHCGNFKTSQLANSSILVFRSLDNKSWKEQYTEYLLHKDALKPDLHNSNSEIGKYFLVIQLHILSSLNDSQEIGPMFCVTKIDCSLRTYIDQYRTEINSLPTFEHCFYEEICRLLKQVLTGLDYLHNKSQPIVHYDLTVDSIGYNKESSQIKLSSISMETKVKINYSIQSEKELREISHFPAQILEKDSTELYTSQTDIYCLGVVLYYLWTGRHPFDELIHMRNINNLNKFVELLNSERLQNLLEDSEFDRGFAAMVFTWCILCFEKKFTANTFLRNLNTNTYYGEITD